MLRDGKTKNPIILASNSLREGREGVMPLPFTKKTHNLFSFYLEM